jgi:hypothetical protein
MRGNVTPFWLMVFGLGLTWFVTTGRAKGMVDALLSEPKPLQMPTPGNNNITYTTPQGYNPYIDYGLS